jgi:hypothetical protein
VSPCLKGRGPFIARRRLDNYKLFISVSMKGFIWPLGPILRRYICRGLLDASTVFGPVLEPSRLPLIVPWALNGCGEDGAQVSSWRGCLVRYLLGGDIFPYGAMRWTG